MCKKCLLVLTFQVHINELGRLLWVVKCSELGLENMVLSEADIRVLVTTIRDNVEIVEFGDDIFLDIEEICKAWMKFVSMTAGAAAGKY